MRVLWHALLGVALVQPLARGEAAQAQEPSAGRPALAVGDRVRVITATAQKAGGPIRGTLIALDHELMTLAIDDGRSAPLQLPIRTVSKLEVSRGRKGNPLAGAIAGFAGGAAIGFVLAPEQPSAVLCTVNNPNCAPSTRRPGVVLAFGAVGAALGAFAGQLIGTERWTLVDVQALEVTLRPASGPSLGAAVTIRF